MFLVPAGTVSRGQMYVRKYEPDDDPDYAKDNPDGPPPRWTVCVDGEPHDKVRAFARLETAINCCFDFAQDVGSDGVGYFYVKFDNYDPASMFTDRQQAAADRIVRHYASHGYEQRNAWQPYDLSPECKGFVTTVVSRKGRQCTLWMPETADQYNEFDWTRSDVLDIP